MANSHIVGIYDDFEEARRTLQILGQNGYPVEKLSVLSPGMHSKGISIAGTLSSGELIGAGVASGAWWGGVLGVFMSILAPLVIGRNLYEPPVPYGTLLILFTLGLTTGCVCGAIIGGLTGWRIGAKFIGPYTSRLTAGKHALVVEGVDVDLADRAVQIIRTQSTQAKSTHAKNAQTQSQSQGTPEGNGGVNAA